MSLALSPLTAAVAVGSAGLRLMDALADRVGTCDCVLLHPF